MDKSGRLRLGGGGGAKTVSGRTFKILKKEKNRTEVSGKERVRKVDRCVCSSLLWNQKG